MTKPGTLTQKRNESVAWFIGKARTGNGFRNNLISNDGRSRDNTIIGKLYFFYYDPKHKKTLPVYDRFPMVFPIERYKDGFLGLNLHYLSVPERESIFKKLLELRTNTTMNSTTKLKISYEIVSSSRRLNTPLRPCIKRYLFTHVRSRFIEIDSSEWEQALHLPVELFVRKN